jgi:hypothetical protein
VRGAKSTGRWLWAASLAAESPELELNDAGRVITADGRTWEGDLTYRQTQPGRVFHAWQWRLGSFAEWNYGGDRQFGEAVQTLALTWKNFHRTALSGFYGLASQDERRTRGGPSMGTPPSWGGVLNHSSSSTARMRWNLGASLVHDGDGQRSWDGGGGYSYRAGPRLQFSIDGYYIRSTSPRQYVTTIEGGRPETYGDRYVFSFIDQTTLTTPLRLGYTFTPDLTLDLYAEPFAASGRYYDHGELREPRGRALRTYGTEGTTIATHADGSLLVTDGGSSFTLDNLDFRVRSFRSNLVLRWEWRRGSTLYVVWQRDRYGDEGVGLPVGPRDLLRSLSAPGGNLFLIKASFWLGL